MFRKPIKIKSNTPVKSSERKNIRDKIQKQYPILTEDNLNELLPKKEALNSIKVITASNEIVQIYSIQKRPICFELNGRVFPTIYFLWQFPNIIYNLTTHKEVMGYINTGADLMLPGVITPPTNACQSKYGRIQNDSIVGVNLTSNKAAVAVGTTCMSSEEMEKSGGRGKCVCILHFYGDKLSTLDGQNLPHVPNMEPPEWLLLKSYEDDFPSLNGKNNNQKIQVESESVDIQEPQDHFDSQNDISLAEIDSVKNINTSDNVNVDNPQEMTTEDMDELLYFCFFSAIKYSKTLTLPILTSNFYKLQLLAACPSDKSLDIKKTSFKKLKPFLDKMSKDGVITVKEMKKGVESITAINKSHPQVEAFYVKPEDRPNNRNRENVNCDDSKSVTESYIITESVLPLFNYGAVKFHKGDTVVGPTIRNSIREYVMNNKCLHENPKLVQLDPTLTKICKGTNPIAWEEVYEKVCKSMKTCFKVKTGTEEIVNKGKISPIIINVANRSGNKKVTLIENLELYGIRVGEFAKECQHGVAASTSISLPPGKKTEQLLVQGNQVIFVHNLLVDKYKIPKRCIRGLENAPKKK